MILSSLGSISFKIEKIKPGPCDSNNLKDQVCFRQSAIRYWRGRHHTFCFIKNFNWLGVGKTLFANGGRRYAKMLFEKVIEMGSGFVAQPSGDFQNGQVGIGQQFLGMRELDAAPIRND